MTVYFNIKKRMWPLIVSTARNKFFLWNIFGNIGPLLFALFAIPYIYSNSTKEYVGFLTLIWAAIGYTGLFDFGLSRAIFYFSSLNKLNRNLDLKVIILNSSIFSIIISTIINVVFLIFKDHHLVSSYVKDHDQINSLFIILFSLPIYLISNMIRSALEGMELFKEANIFKFFSYISLFVCPVLLIVLNDRSLAHVCAFYTVVRLLTCIYAFVKLIPHVKISVNRTQIISIPMRMVLGFGGWATVSSTISPLMVYGDRFAIAYFNGASAIAVYALLQEFIGKTILFSASYVTSIQPKMGYLPQAEARKLYNLENRNIALLSGGIYAACLLISPLFVSIWLDVNLSEVAFLAIAMSIGFMFNSMAQVPLAYLLARGAPHRVAHCHAVEAILYFPLLIVAAMHYGVAGAAIAGVLRQIFDYGILSWQAHRQTA